MIASWRAGSRSAPGGTASANPGNEYVSLSLAAPEFGPRRLYANLGRAAGQDDDDAFAIIWNPAD
ncbi:DUF736 family protein [Hankyongella ginsenosidimutans]|uniref:DUF736 family protein n=1 Tax=Hankyongella ginsenosidimutans TaxID=1763828 RepID=UPI003CCC8E4F